MLTATDVRTSKTAKIKKLVYYTAAHRHIFAVFDVRTSVAVNTCI